MPKYCKCTFEYEACDDDELTLKEGDIIEVTDDTGEGWWVGKLKGKLGTFPNNFVEAITPEEAGVSAPPQPKPQVPAPAPTASLPAGAGKSSVRARADFQYEAGDEDELSFQEGDIIDVLDKNPGTSGWWKASMDGKVGLVPDNFFTIIETKARSSTSSASLPSPSGGAPVITAAALAAPLKKTSPAAKPEPTPAPAATTDWRAQLKNRNQGRKSQPSIPQPGDNSAESMPEWMRKRKAACGEDGGSGDAPAKEAVATPPKTQPSPKPTTGPSVTVPRATTPSRSTDPPMPKFPPRPAGAAPTSAASNASSSASTSTLAATKTSTFGRPPSVSSAGRTSSISSSTSNPGSRRSSDTPIQTSAAPAIPEGSRNNAKASFRKKRSMTSVSDSVGSISPPPSARPSTSADSQQLTNIMEMVTALQTKVTSLETSLKTMQGTIHNLESEVDSEKKLRSSCEVELQRIRQKLNEKEMNSI